MLSEEERKRQADAGSYCATEDEGKNDGDDGSCREEEEEEDSMISDAASHAPWPTAALLPGRYKELKKLKKKPFSKALDHDGSLEDTASSPVNSPKVSYILQSIILLIISVVKVRLLVMLIWLFFGFLL
jgi:hypothetical protein